MPRDISKAFDFNLKFERKVTIGISVIAFLFVAGVSAAYFLFPAYREGIAFFAIAVGTAAAIVSAFYVAQSVYANVESERMTRTMSLVSEWNAASFFDAKQAVIRLMKPIADRPREERLTAIRERVGDDDALELNLTSVLNYLEHLAVLVDRGFVDEALVRELFQTNVLRYYEVLEPWIADMRNRRGKRLYKDIANLYEKWHI